MSCIHSSQTLDVIILQFLFSPPQLDSVFLTQAEDTWHNHAHDVFPLSRWWGGWTPPPPPPPFPLPSEWMRKHGPCAVTWQVAHPRTFCTGQTGIWRSSWCWGTMATPGPLWCTAVALQWIHPAIWNCYGAQPCNGVNVMTSALRTCNLEPWHKHAHAPTLRPQNPWLWRFLTLWPPHLEQSPLSHHAILSSFKGKLKIFLFSEYFS